MSDSEKVSVPSDNPLGPCPAYMFGNPSTTRTAVIVLQEWWGVTEGTLDAARVIGERSGSVTLVPDLYRGKVAADRETAGHYNADLDWRGAVTDIGACASYLKSQGCTKVGVTGFCQGGALTIAAAASPTANQNIDAAAPFYGIPRADIYQYDITQLKSIPMQCHFGKLDAVVGFSSPNEYLPFLARLREIGCNVEGFEYDAGHAFTNKKSPNFNEEAYKLSYGRMVEFFQKYLQG